MKIGTVLKNVRITDINIEGKGVGKTSDGIVIFCENTIPNDIINAEIIKIKKNYIECKIIDIIEKSPFRKKPECKHFYECNGCTLQHLQYNQQIQYKIKHIQNVFERIGKLTLNQNIEIQPNQKEFYYRNKIEFTLNRNEENIQCGYHLKNQPFQILDIEECLLFDPNLKEFLIFLKNKLIKHNILIYNLKDKKGILRNLLIKKNSHNEWILSFGVLRNQVDQIKKIAEELNKKFPFIQSIYYSIFQKQDDFYSAKTHKILGKESIKEEIQGIQFLLKPHTFFQINREQVSYIFDYIKKIIKPLNIKIAYDLYCGVGTWSFAIAKEVEKIKSIEQVKSAILDAQEIAKINQIKNIVFYEGKVEDIIEEFEEKPELMIVDPPRNGLSETLIKKILKILPEYILYISCNVSTQARDIHQLKDDYSIEHQKAFDMFPQTTQFENIVFMKKKEFKKFRSLIT